jgi:hypothetical protein
MQNCKGHNLCKHEKRKIVKEFIGHITRSKSDLVIGKEYCLNCKQHIIQSVPPRLVLPNKILGDHLQLKQEFIINKGAMSLREVILFTKQLYRGVPLLNEGFSIILEVGKDEDK